MKYERSSGYREARQRKETREDRREGRKGRKEGGKGRKGDLDNVRVQDW